MAKKKIVYIDVVVDDKGTTKRMAVEAKQLGTALNKTSTNARDTQKRLKGVGQQSSNSTKNFSKMTSGINGGLVPAYATLAAQVFAVTAAFAFLKDAGDLARLEAGQSAYSAAVGVSMKSLTKDIVAATDAQLGFRDAAQAAAIGTAAGLTSEQLVKLGKAANQTSQILGRDLTDSFNRLIRGVTKAEPELLDELGIILRLKDATGEYADALGVNVNSLTSFQRTQAVTANVLGQVEAKYARILAITGEAPNSFAKLSASFEGLVNTIKKVMATGLGPLVDLLSEFPQLVALAFLPFTTSVLRAALPGLEDMGDTMRNLSVKAKEGFDGAVKEQKAYTKEVDKLRGDTAQQAALKKEIKADAQASKKMAKFRSNTLLARMQRGDILDKNQIARVERNLKKQVGAYKIKDKKVLASLQASLAKMKLLNNSAMGSIESRVARAGVFIGTTWRATAVAANSAFASMAAGAAVAGGYITTALSALSWITLIASLGAVVYSFFRAGKSADDTADKYDHMAEKLEQVNSETEKYIQIQNVLYDKVLFANEAVAALGRNFSQFSSMFIADTAGAEYFTDIASSIAGVRKEAASSIPGLKEQIALLEKNAKNPTKTTGALGINTGDVAALSAARTKLAEATAKTGLSLEKYLETAENLTKSQKLSIQRLLDEKNMIEQHKNERFKSSAIVQKYLVMLQKATEGQKVDTKEMEEARDAVINLGRSIDSLTRLRKENTDAFRNIESNIIPLSEMDQLIANMQLEVSLVEQHAALQKRELLPDERERLAIVEKRVNFLRIASEIEFRSASALRALQISEINMSRNKTALVKDEVKSLHAMAAIEVKIFTAEQKIAQARELNRQKQQEINSMKVGENGVTQKMLDNEIDTLTARDKAIIQEEDKLRTLQAQRQTLADQRNEMQQLQNVAVQSFETNLESGIAALIKGTENSLKDALLNLAQGVMNSMADFLAKSFTKKIMMGLTGEKTPEVKMAQAIQESGQAAGERIKVKMILGAEEAGTIIANRIAKITGAKHTTTPTDTSIGAGAAEDPNLTIGDKLVESQGKAKVKQLASEAGANGKLGGVNGILAHSAGLYKPESPGSETKSVNKGTGIFSGFINGFKNIFESNTKGGFLGKRGKTFMSGIEGFGSLFSDMLGGIFGGGGGGGLLSSLFGGGTAAVAAGRYGGLMKGYSQGGVARGRNAGYPAILHGTEAVVPLPNGNSIPVEMRNGGGGTNNVGININIDSSGSAQSSGDGGADQASALGKAISGAVKEELQRQKRPGGILSPFGAA